MRVLGKASMSSVVVALSVLAWTERAARAQDPSVEAFFRGKTMNMVIGYPVGGANDNFWFDDLCITTLPAPGRQIPGLYNTGVDAEGKPFKDNAIDLHYRLTFGGTTAYVATDAGGFPIPPWLGSNSMSAWISPAHDTLGLSDGLGTFNYSYRTTFLLTGMDLSTVRLAGRWATDNNGVDILINGVSTGQSNTNQFGSWTPFVITTGFVNGVNTLTFVVNNGSPGSPAGSDPTGLRVELWGSGLLDCALAGSIGSGPALTIARQPGNNLRITWPEFGFVLQGARDATGPWHDLTRGTSINGRDHAATLPAAGAHRFFRLRLDCE